MNRFFCFVASLQVTCILLVALFALVFWGTLFEARAGLNYGVERFFNSWFLDVAGVIPVPALKTLAVLLCVNLIFAIFFRIPRSINNIGLYLIHFSLILIVSGSFIESYFRSSSEIIAAVGEKSVKYMNYDSLDINFYVVSADSFSCTIEINENGKSRLAFITPNSPLHIKDFFVYFSEFIEYSNITFVRLWIKRDPFYFIPYVYSVLFFIGFILLFLKKMNIKTNKKALYCWKKNIF